MISKIVHMGLSVPKRNDVIKDTMVTAAAVTCIAAVILGIDSSITGVMTLIANL